MTRAAGMTGKSKPESAPVTDEVAVHRLVITRFHSYGFAVPGTDDRAAPQRTMYADGRCTLKIPAPPLETGRFIGQNSCGAYVDQIP